MNSTADRSLRQHLVDLLSSEHAHVGLRKALDGLPAKSRGVRPKGAEHSIWELLEHLRIAQWDILEFSRDAKHVSPKFPEGYWPARPAPPSEAAWKKSIADFERDLEAMKKLVLDESSDLFAKIPHGDGQTLLREALLAADHNAYHIGQIVLARRLLGAWKA
jgi:DinB superfamily